MSTTVNSIPASDIVDIIPSVLPAGGEAVDLSGLMLTTNNRVPIGTAQSFPNVAAVGSFFGLTAPEYTECAVPYFLGPDNSLAKPGALWFAQYPTGNVGAWLRGGSLATVSLTALQAITGVLTVTIDGTPHTSSSINLSSATSFTAAAELINNALGVTGPNTASVTGSIGATFTGTGSGTNLTTTAVTGVIHTGDALTGTGIPANTTIVSQTSGTPGGAGVYVTNNVTTSSGSSITADSTTLDVTAVGSGALAANNEITGSGIAANTYIVAQLTGTTGGIGTYQLTGAAQEAASTTVTATMPVVTWDSVASAFYVVSSTTGTASSIGFGSGTIAAPLALTAATGATTSQGAAAATPATFMANILNVTQDWFSFSTMFDPDNGSGTTQKLAFAAWNNSQNNRFAYVGWDTDITPTESTSATSSFGYQATITENYSGILPLYSPAQGVALASFTMGYWASLNFDATDGRTTLKFQSQTGLSPDITSLAVADNLRANGYNFYGVWATAKQQFNFMADGTISGPFQWADSYADQVWMSSSFQADLLTFLKNARSVPYNPSGYAQIKAVCLDTIQAAINFGAIRQGVPLSNAQIAEVNTAAGTAIDSVLSSQGWFLQVLPASPTVRQQRGSPPFNFWWMDGQSIQKLTMNSILVQ